MSHKTDQNTNIYFNIYPSMNKVVHISQFLIYCPSSKKTIVTVYHDNILELFVTPRLKIFKCKWKEYGLSYFKDMYPILILKLYRKENLLLL